MTSDTAGSCLVDHVNGYCAKAGRGSNPTFWLTTRFFRD